MLGNVYDIFICVVGVVGLAYVGYLVRHGDRERHEEDDARRFFDAHGHWPDETPEQAEAERRRLAASAGAPQPPLSQPSGDGFV